MRVEENSKQVEWPIARMLSVAIGTSLFAHALFFGGFSAIFAGDDGRRSLTSSGDVIQLTEFEFKEARSPSKISPDSPPEKPNEKPNEKPPEKANPDVPPDVPVDKTAKKPRKKPRPTQVATQGVVLPSDPNEPDAGAIEIDSEDGGMLADNADGGAVDPDAPPAAASAELGQYAPGDARIIAIVHADRVRQSVMREGADALLSVLPDTQLVLGKTGLNVFDDFDTLMVATSDPADLSMTLLAGRGTRGANALMRALGGKNSERVRWTRAAGRVVGERVRTPDWDPRKFVVADEGWMVLARPEQLGALGELTGKPKAGESDGGGDVDGGVVESPAWAKRLHDIRTVAGEEPDGPALVVALADIANTLRLPDSARAMLPKQATIAVRLDAETAVIWGTLLFPDEVAAGQFQHHWAELKQFTASQKMAVLFGLPDLLDRVEITVEQSVVRLRTKVTAVQANALLKFSANTIETRLAKDLLLLRTLYGQ